MHMDLRDQVWAEEVADRLIKKERLVAERNQGRIPYLTENHHFNDQSGAGITWWTNGFWGGMMWQLYHATKEEIFLENAIDTENKMDQVLLNYNAMDHDAGFRWLPTAVADYRVTGDQKAKNRGLLAAANLAGRYNPNGRFIRAWNDWGDGRDTTGFAIIDCMMNLPLLYWASKELGDPRFSQIAEFHAYTVMKNFIREDGSVRHIVEFQPVTGEFVKEHGGQGMAEGSSWTRGQGWALYGFALSLFHTGKEDFLHAAIAVADAFVKRIPDSGLIPVDFDQPADIAWQDGTAAAIAACGLLTLADEIERERNGQNGETSWHMDFSREEKAKVYRTAALKLLRALDKDGCDYDPEHDELLTKCSVSYHDAHHDHSIIYGDYYYIEAIWKLTGRELFVW